MARRETSVEVDGVETASDLVVAKKRFLAALSTCRLVKTWKHPFCVADEWDASDRGSGDYGAKLR